MSKCVHSDIICLKYELGPVWHLKGTKKKISSKILKHIFLIKDHMSKHSVDARQIKNKTYIHFDMEETAF